MPGEEHEVARARAGLEVAELARRIGRKLGGEEQVTVATQWGPLVLFLVVFVLCVSLTVYAIVRAIKDKPGPGEEAA